MQAIDTGNANKKKQCLFPRSSHSNEDRQVENSNLTDIRQLRVEEGKDLEQRRQEHRKNPFPGGGGS